MQAATIPDIMILTLFDSRIYPFALIVARPHGRAGCEPVYTVFTMSRVCLNERQILITSSSFEPGDYDFDIYGQRNNLNINPDNASFITTLPVKIKANPCA